MVSFAPLMAGFSAGSVHVLAGPDHLAAVAPLAATRNRPWATGLLWGLGHAGGVLLVGAAAVLFRELLPVELLSSWSERLVGVVLIGIGVWGARRAARQSVHAHQHAHDGGQHAHLHMHGHPVDAAAAHVHSGAGSHTHPTTQAAFSVGILHGLAGSAHFLGVLPALGFGTRSAAVAYVAAFGVGTVVAMTAFAALIGWITARFARGGTTFYRLLLYGFSIAAIAIGAYWLAG